jgi:hypothetical protein
MDVSVSIVKNFLYPLSRAERCELRNEKSKVLVDQSDIGNEEGGRLGQLLLDCFSRSNDTVPTIPAKQDLRPPAARTAVCNSPLSPGLKAGDSMGYVQGRE